MSLRTSRNSYSDDVSFCQSSVLAMAQKSFVSQGSTLAHVERWEPGHRHAVIWLRVGSAPQWTVCTRSLTSQYIQLRSQTTLRSLEGSCQARKSQPKPSHSTPSDASRKWLSYLPRTWTGHRERWVKTSSHKWTQCVAKKRHFWTSFLSPI